MTNSQTARMFKAFCDERRLEILERLQQGEQCATELIEKLGIGQSTLSHHMKILCDSGVVIMRKERNFVYYSISEEGSNQIKEILDGITKIRGYKPEGSQEV